MAPICRLHPAGSVLPLRPFWWRGKDSNLRRRKPADLQSAPVGRLGTPPQNEPRIVISEVRSVNASLARYLLGGRRAGEGLMPRGPADGARERGRAGCTDPGAGLAAAGAVAARSRRDRSSPWTAR